MARGVVNFHKHLTGQIAGWWGRPEMEAQQTKFNFVMYHLNVKSS